MEPQILSPDQIELLTDEKGKVITVGLDSKFKQLNLKYVPSPNFYPLSMREKEYFKGNGKVSLNGAGYSITVNYKVCALFNAAKWQCLIHSSTNKNQHKEARKIAIDTAYVLGGQIAWDDVYLSWKDEPYRIYILVPIKRPIVSADKWLSYLRNTDFCRERYFLTFHRLLKLINQNSTVDDNYCSQKYDEGVLVWDAVSHYIRQVSENDKSKLYKNCQDIRIEPDSDNVLFHFGSASRIKKAVAKSFEDLKTGDMIKIIHGANKHNRTKWKNDLINTLKHAIIVG